MKTLEEVYEMYNDFSKWQRELWGNHNDPMPALDHLLEEVEEIKDAPYDLIEYADAFLLLCAALDRTGYNLDDLLEAVKLKHEINKKRKWLPPDENGIVRHIKERGGGDE